MAEFGRLYIWFVIIMAAIASIPRLLFSRRFAELQQAKLQQRRNSLVRSRNLGLIIFVLVLIFGGAYFNRWGHEVWFGTAIVFSLLSAAEIFFRAQFPSTDALVFQNRLLGILYLGLSIGAFIMRSRS